jgi:trimeric autotransporter adhesin
MKKIYILLLMCAAFASILYISTLRRQSSHRVPLVTNELNAKEVEEEEKEGYDGPAERDQLEFDQTVDPALGYVPYTRLKNAIEYTHQLKSSAASRSASTMLWVERGPIYDSVGPSNGNTRGGNLYTSGRMAAVLVDTLNDPTGNTVIVGGISGGIWRCTNFLSSIPDWRNVFDYFDNMAISSLCQDPSNPSVMYFSTGEATSNADAHFGQGIWKSTDKGLSWSFLPSTVTFIRNFKILCDPAGNIYLAARTTTTPALQPNGLMRSKNGGATWTNITPTGLTSTNSICSDIELSSTGKLHASFGYQTAGGVVNHRYTNDPANVTSASGWNASTGIRVANTPAAVRLELACLADTLYGVTVNTSYNSDSCYRSIDGGATWTKQNAAIMPGGILSGQGWYNETLAINPANSAELICGGLDAYRSINGGSTWTRMTFWVTSVPYVHADHHYIQWTKKGNESRVVIGCDGGVFYSNDGGLSWLDKNRNLSLKQFYAGAIHPAAGSSYLLAGAQDNGTHQLKNPGLSYSTEVTGGDGMYVYINQLDPNIQFGSYVYNQYRRTTNGGQTWSAVNLSGSGLFANPYDYDDAQNFMYACLTANNILRWPNANTANVANTLAVPLLGGGAAGAVKVSPHTLNRVYLGGTSGRVVRIDDANAAATFTDLTAVGMVGNIHCVNVGSSDNFLVATMTNYGVNNVWFSNNGGTSWTAVDGNLPDMPVWWAIFDPYNNNKLILGTETGVWTTEQVNGASTVWDPSPGFPTTRVSMLRVRTSDNTVVAATYGRGLFTAILPPPAPQISFVLPSSNYTEQTDFTTGCRSYRDYSVALGIVNPPTGNATVTFNVQSGSAVRGVDYDFTTNGSFTAPSNQHVFVNGATGAAALKTITVRIYDDAEVESLENFTIGFTISGATNAVAGSIPVHSIGIKDNDRFPLPFLSGNYNIGTYNTDMASLNTPFDGTKQKHRLQVLYRASELNAAGITTIAKMTSMKLRVKTKNTTQAFKNLNISIANAPFSHLGGGYVISVPFTTVFASDYSTVVGDNTFNFLTPFQWDGTSNIVVQFCFDNSPAAAQGGVDIVEGMAAPFGAGTRASTYSNHTTSTAGGCYIASAFVDDNRVNAGFAASFGDPVATVLNSTKSEYLTSNTDLFYYTPAGEIMARVLNLSAHDYGCTQVVIDRAGTGVSQFWNTNPANYLMNKTFRIIPTTNNTSGKYEVTFYFTKAEKDGWEAATGQSWSNIQLVKLPSRISNVTPLNAQPDGPGTIQVVDPVRRTFGPVHYTVSFLLENGFSGYGFGVAGRMNTILTLTGSSNPNNIDVDLSWTTSVEINSTIFEVEKSYDGVTFHKIGTVPASFNKLTPSSYGFVDHENTQYNYYRIKMLHTDGYILYSNTIFIKRDNAPQKLFVTPNPFNGLMTVRLARPSTGPVTFSLYDAGGKLVKRVVGAGGAPSYDINTSGILSRAIYVLKVNADGQEISRQVMKQ